MSIYDKMLASLDNTRWFRYVGMAKTANHREEILTITFDSRKADMIIMYFIIINHANHGIASEYAKWRYGPVSHEAEVQ